MAALVTDVRWCTLTGHVQSNKESLVPPSTAKGAGKGKPSARVAISALLCAWGATDRRGDRGDGCRVMIRNPHRQTLRPAGYLTCGPTAQERQLKQLTAAMLRCGCVTVDGGICKRTVLDGVGTGSSLASRHADTSYRQATSSLTS